MRLPLWGQPPGKYTQTGSERKRSGQMGRELSRRDLARLRIRHCVAGQGCGVFHDRFGVFKELLRDPDPTRGQRDVLDPPIGGVKGPGNEPFLLKASQDAGRLAGIHAEAATQLLYRGGRVHVQEANGQGFLDCQPGPAGKLLARLPAEEDEVKEVTTSIMRL